MLSGHGGSSGLMNSFMAGAAPHTQGQIWRNRVDWSWAKYGYRDCIWLYGSRENIYYIWNISSPESNENTNSDPTRIYNRVGGGNFAAAARPNEALCLNSKNKYLKLWGYLPGKWPQDFSQRRDRTSAWAITVHACVRDQTRHKQTFISWGYRSALEPREILGTLAVFGALVGVLGASWSSLAVDVLSLFSRLDVLYIFII